MEKPKLTRTEYGDLESLKELEANEEKDLCEFGVVHEDCYFCGQPRMIRFDEHYYFCPNCSAIYTFNIIIEANCNHIDSNKRIPIVSRVPSRIINQWGDGQLIRISPSVGKVYIEEDDHCDQTCSVCHQPCIADGW